jgi:guanylate kinase
LRGRGTDTEEVIRRRLRDAASDMAHWREFDRVVVNDDFDRALGELEAIVAGAPHPGGADRAAALEALAKELTRGDRG